MFFESENNMGKLTLYGIDASAPVRSVLFTLNALDIPFDYQIVNLFSKEHLSPEFLKMNPQHTVPTLDDDGFYVYDSHAINSYLVSKYGKDDSLYPKDLQERAAVDQRLYYEASVVYNTIKNIVYPLVFLNETTIPQSKFDAISGVYQTVDTFVEKHSYVAGDQLTIADFHLVTMLTTLTTFVDIDAEKYPKLNNWLSLLKDLPYYEKANAKGLEDFGNMIKSKNYTVS
ncbi:glutathione S-transferase 1 [Drosophila willistoni]|nr:glutathione S-transferase 1 [Drosophila willistoni]